MNIAVSTAALASASIVPKPAHSAPASAPLDIERARPELLHAFRNLQEAYEKLLVADETFRVAFDFCRGWEKDHPQPGYYTRAYRKWERWRDKMYEKASFFAALDTVDGARNAYREAQDRLCLVRALDYYEVSIKAVASLSFEGAILDEEKRRSLRTESQRVAFSVAMDTVTSSRRAASRSLWSGALPTNMTQLNQVILSFMGTNGPFRTRTHHFLQSPSVLLARKSTKRGSSEMQKSLTPV